MAAPRRNYTDDEKAAGLAALAACGGDVSKAARACGVNRRAIQRWRDEAPEVVVQIAQGKADDLATLMERIAHRAAGCIELALDVIEVDPMLAVDKLSDLNRIAGTATDKVQLLRIEHSGPAGGPIQQEKRVIIIDLSDADA